MKKSNSIYVYTTFITLLIALYTLSFFTRLSLIPLVLIIFYSTSLVLMYKRNRFAKIINQISLLITASILSLNLYTLIHSGYNYKDSFLQSLLVFYLSIIIISVAFIIYWQKSQAIKSFFDKSTTGSQATDTSKTGPDALNNIQNTYKFNSDHLVVLSIFSFISCMMFLFTGWGFLFAIPISLVFSLVYVLIFAFSLKRNNARAFAVYSVIITLILSYVSILLNIGVASDSPETYYISTGLFGVPSTSLKDIFDQLLNISYYYLIFSIPVNLLFIKKNANKIIFSIIPVLGILLIGTHFGFIYKNLPELRAQVIKSKQTAQKEEQENIEKRYEYNPQNINKKTFENRLFSIFTPPEPDPKISTNDCPYSLKILNENITKDPMSVSCLNEWLSEVKQVPFTDKNPFSITLSNSRNTLLKGYVMVLVVELENPSYVRIYANGNPAKDCGCRMWPYDYTDIEDHKKIGTSTIIYEQSVVQAGVTDKKRTIMILYPININGLKDLNFKLSQLDDKPDVKVTLKEFGILRPKPQTPDPEWLIEWSKKPNPFLK